jgi:hypothetical protein
MTSPAPATADQYLQEQKRKNTCNLLHYVVNYLGIPHRSGFFAVCFSLEKWA